jgi:hypothetical protein
VLCLEHHLPGHVDDHFSEVTAAQIPSLDKALKQSHPASYPTPHVMEKRGPCASQTASIKIFRLPQAVCVHGSHTFRVTHDAVSTQLVIRSDPDRLGKDADWTLPIMQR